MLKGIFKEMKENEKKIKCRICCNRDATGINYGVISCRSCKTFFQRFSTKQSNNRCSISTRCHDSCKSCRYQKCVDAGMSKELKKLGRPKFLQESDKIIISSLERVEKIELNKNFIDFNHLIPKLYMLYMNHNISLVTLIKGSIETSRLLINRELTSWIGLIENIPNCFEEVISYFKTIPGMADIVHEIDLKNELIGYFILKEFIEFYQNKVFITLPDGLTKYPFYNSFSYKMVDFDLKYNSIGVLPRESSFILPIILTMDIKNEKFQQLNDYYKAGFNHELCLNKREIIFEQVIELVDKYYNGEINGPFVSDYALQNLCDDALLDLDF